MLSVPVIGAGTAVSAVARSLGKRVGIIGITEYVPEPYRRILGDDLIDLGRPEGVTCTPVSYTHLDVYKRQGVCALYARLTSRG